jgi:type I restriction enzyme R subunit
LDLLYEARDVEQFVTNQVKIDDWFDAKQKD